MIRSHIYPLQPPSASLSPRSKMDTVLENNVQTPADSQYELSTLGPDPSSGVATPSGGSQAQLTVLERSEPGEGTTFQELAPVDRGLAAWTFCACGFLAEMFIWGFLFR